jgi:hypothetical protein
MFGMFRRQQRVRALDTGPAEDPVKTYDRLVVFMRENAHLADAVSSHERKLARLWGQPLEWNNATAEAKTLIGDLSVLPTPQPPSATPSDTPEVPPSAAGPDQAEGGPVW